MQQKFYRCRHCGNIVTFVHSAGVPVVCCGEKMAELIPNTNDGAVEKHVPVIMRENNIVTVAVGSVAHPMTAEHHIEWIMLETKNGNQRKVLQLGAAPMVKFAVEDDDEVISAYAYCNLHFLWKA